MNRSLGSHNPISNKPKRCEGRGNSCVSDLVILVCVVFGALAAGVLAAYGVCLSMFAAFQMHARQVAEKRVVRVQGTASIVGG